MLFQQNKFYCISNRSGVAELIQTVIYPFTTVHAFLSTQVGVSLMVCMFGLRWSVPPIVYKLRSLNDLPEIVLVETARVAPKKPQFRSSTVLTKTAVFGFGLVTVTALAVAMTFACTYAI